MIVVHVGSTLVRWVEVAVLRDHGRVVWVFEDYELDVEQFELRRNGDHVPVEPQVFDVLAYLVERRERVVPKNEILDAVWGDRFVSESALSSRIRAARIALDDDGSAQRMIRTVFGRGFQFVGDVHQQAVGRSEPMPDRLEPVAPSISQTIRFCTTDDGVSLAYASMGDGPPLVRAAHWLTHLDFDLTSPVWRHWLEGLSRDRTLIRYDERGCGMSEHDVDDFSLDAWVSDLETVVDAAGLEVFDIMGLSQGGPVAMVYAVRHPDRVRRLVLCGSYAEGRLKRARRDDDTREALIHQEMARIGWGNKHDTYLQFFASQFIPDGDIELWAEFSRLQRRTTPAQNAARFMKAFAEIDVVDLAAQVTAPTLIFHSRDDQRVPFECGQTLAALIADSRLVPLDSRNHLMREDEPAFGVFLEEMTRFLDSG